MTETMLSLIINSSVWPDIIKRTDKTIKFICDEVVFKHFC